MLISRMALFSTQEINTKKMGFLPVSQDTVRIEEISVSVQIFQYQHF